MIHSLYHQLSGHHPVAYHQASGVKRVLVPPVQTADANSIHPRGQAAPIMIQKTRLKLVSFSIQIDDDGPGPSGWRIERPWPTDIGVWPDKSLLGFKIGECPMRIKRHRGSGRSLLGLEISEGLLRIKCQRRDFRRF